MKEAISLMSPLEIIVLVIIPAVVLTIVIITVMIDLLKWIYFWYIMIRLKIFDLRLKSLRRRMNRLGRKLHRDR